MTRHQSESDVSVSVVVPVYNSGRYLGRCLESIRGQTLRNIEIVAVDDCSTDESTAILRRHASEDVRLRVISHERNEGLHIARMTGAAASTGQYIGYVDSDDFVDTDMFEHMYQAAVEQHADVVRSGARIVSEDNSNGRAAPPNEHVLKFTHRSYATGVDYIDSDFYPCMWLHLHRRRLWHLASPHFPRVRLLGEDNLTSFILAFHADNVLSLDKQCYNYVERAQSLSNDLSIENVQRHIEDRGHIVRLLRAFVDASGGLGRPGLEKVTRDNRLLLFSMIGSLASAGERTRGRTLFEATWLEQVPDDRRNAWARSLTPSSRRRTVT